MKVCLLMIGANQATFLKQCHPVRLFDEFVYVDTSNGADTESLEHLKKIGAHVVPYQWDEHFGNARNAGIEWADKHLDCEWYFHLDCDEFIRPEGLAQLKAIVSNPAFKDAGFIRLPLTTFYQHTSFLTPDQRSGRRPAMWRSNLGLRYRYEIHETLNDDILDKAPGFIDVDVYIWHIGHINEPYEHKNEYYYKKNLRVLEQFPNSYLHLFLVACYNADIDRQVSIQYALRGLACAPSTEWIGNFNRLINDLSMDVEEHKKAAEHQRFIKTQKTLILNGRQ